MVFLFLMITVISNQTFKLCSLILTCVLCPSGDGRYSLLGQPLQYSLCPPPLMHGQSSYNSHQVSLGFSFYINKRSNKASLGINSGYDLSILINIVLHTYNVESSELLGKKK